MPDDVVYRLPDEDPDRMNPSRDREDRGRFNNAAGSDKRGDGFTPQNGSNNSRSRESEPSYQPRNQSQPPEDPMSHQQSPIVTLGGGFPIAPFGAGYGYPYAGFPAVPATGAPVTTVVSGHGDSHGTHSQLETLSDIALGGLRESAAAGRTNQLSTQIESIGDRLDTQASFSRELSLQKEFSTVHARFGDVENRLLSAMKDGELRRSEEDKNLLRSELANAREGRRFDDLRDSVRDLTRLIAERLPQRA